MRAIIRKCGNGAAIRIPASVLEAGRPRVGSVVELRARQGEVVIEAVPNAGESLGDLLKGIKPQNLHVEVDFGGPVGWEAL